MTECQCGYIETGVGIIAGLRPHMVPGTNKACTLDRQDLTYAEKSEIRNGQVIVLAEESREGVIVEWSEVPTRKFADRMVRPE